MLKNLDNTQKAYTSLIFFAILSIVYWIFSDSFSNWSMTINPLVALLVGIILNPAYIVLLTFLFNQYSFRGLVAGFLIAISFDIISLGHSILKSGLLPTDGSTIPLYTYSDTTIYKLFPAFLQNQVGVFILYVIIPVLLIYLAFRIIRRSASFNRILKEAI